MFMIEHYVFMIEYRVYNVYRCVDIYVCQYVSKFKKLCFLFSGNKDKTGR